MEYELITPIQHFLNFFVGTILSGAFGVCLVYVGYKQKKADDMSAWEIYSVFGACCLIVAVSLLIFGVINSGAEIAAVLLKPAGD